MYANWFVNWIIFVQCFISLFTSSVYLELFSVCLNIRKLSILATYVLHPIRNVHQWLAQFKYVAHAYYVSEIGREKNVRKMIGRDLAGWIVSRSTHIPVLWVLCVWLYYSSINKHISYTQKCDHFVRFACAFFSTFFLSSSIFLRIVWQLLYGEGKKSCIERYFGYPIHNVNVDFAMQENGIVGVG